MTQRTSEGEMEVLQKFFLLIANLGILQTIKKQSADLRTYEILLYTICSFGMLKKNKSQAIQFEHLYEETINTTGLLARKFK